jgi:hypothetical protein
MHALARMLVPTKTPVLAVTVAYRKFVVSKIRMTELPVLERTNVNVTISIP